MANFITSLRIIFSIALLFCSALSPAFYTLYVAAGLTDMIDGPVARKTNTVSKFGAELDTFADAVFIIVCLIKLLPIFDFPMWIYVWAAGIALIKAINIISGYVARKKLVLPHTGMNKLTGALLFALPLIKPVIDLKYSAAVVCAVATYAAIQEGHYIR